MTCEEGTCSVEWTQAHGDRYRASYDTLSFEDKRFIYNAILSRYLQVSETPTYLLQCLERLNRAYSVIVELGGYDGSQALHILKQYPRMAWHNYDLSEVSQYFTKSALSQSKLHYSFHLLESPFIMEDLPTADIFYTSKTLEHLRWHEIKSVLNKAKHIPYQVHVIDWFWRDDTHVVEQNYHPELVRHLKRCGYKVMDEFSHPERTHIFAGPR